MAPLTPRTCHPFERRPVALARLDTSGNFGSIFFRPSRHGVSLHDRTQVSYAVSPLSHPDKQKDLVNFLYPGLSTFNFRGLVSNFLSPLRDGVMIFVLGLNIIGRK